MLYLAWKHTGHDPFQLYHGLAADYSPLEPEHGGVGGWAVPAGRVLPADPRRARNVVLGFALIAEAESVERAAARL